MQPVNVEVLHSNERPHLTAVFGTSSPPSGLSGSIRRFAFRYSESSYGHWLGNGYFFKLIPGRAVADEQKRQFVFYRWHIPDAIYFNENIRVTLQQIGGGMKSIVKDMVNKGINLKPVTVDATSGFVRLLDMEKPMNINDPNFPEGWVNFYRVDDYSAVSYFYLDKPSSNLPQLPSVNARIEGLIPF